MKAIIYKEMGKKSINGFESEILVKDLLNTINFNSGIKFNFYRSYN